MSLDRNQWVPKPAVAGFTIIELMVTLAVAAILISMAIPSMRDLSMSSGATGQANKLLVNLNTARSEALKNATNVRVSAVGGSWNNGWNIAVDRNMNGVIDAADGDIAILDATAAKAGYTWTALTQPGGAAVTQFFYTATGELSTPTVGVLFKITRPDALENPAGCKRVLIAGSGRTEGQKGGTTQCV